jgi:hypothetical protein
MTFLNQFQTATIVSLLTVFSIPAIAQLTPKVIAHNVEISEEVAATFHIEPDHNPQVNQPTTAWFALTRRGGSSIPLSQCNCILQVYPVPRAHDAKPLSKPALIPLNVEKYREIPGAKITFPQVGAYELEISGTAKDESFSPFKLTYTVNVVP